jgi:hypothetical protein
MVDAPSLAALTRLAVGVESYSASTKWTEAYLLSVESGSRGSQEVPLVRVPKASK